SVGGDIVNRYIGMLSAFRGVNRDDPFGEVLSSTNKSGNYSPDLGPIAVAEKGAVLSFGSITENYAATVSWPEASRSVSNFKDLMHVLENGNNNSVRMFAAMGDVLPGQDLVEAPVLRFHATSTSIGRR